MTRALRLVQPTPDPRVVLDDECRDVLAKLDNHRVGLRSLERLLAKLGRERADAMGEVLRQNEARLRRDLPERERAK